MPPALSASQLVQFLRRDLSVSERELSLVFRDPEASQVSLPMLLWKYGLITIDQLGQIFDWIEHQQICPVLRYLDNRAPSESNIPLFMLYS